MTYWQSVTDKWSKKIKAAGDQVELGKRWLDAKVEEPLDTFKQRYYSEKNWPVYNTRQREMLGSYESAQENERLREMSSAYQKQYGTGQVLKEGAARLAELGTKTGLEYVMPFVPGEVSAKIIRGEPTTPLEKGTEALALAPFGFIRGGGKAVAKTAKAVEPVIETAVTKLTKLIKSAKPVRELTEGLKHEELIKRAGGLSEKLAEGTGREAFQAAKGTLKGQLPKAAFEAPEVGLQSKDVTELFDTIRTSELRPFDKLNTAEALEKTLLGELPTEGEIKNLERMFGSDFAKALMGKRPLSKKIWEEIVGALNLPRAILASFDLSAPLRQGVVLATSYPKEWARGWVPMIKAFGSEKYAGLVDNAIRTHKNFPLMDDAGLQITNWKGVSASLAEREEAFMTKLSQKIPGVAHSERAYVTYLNKLRADVFNKVVDAWEGTGKTLGDYKELANFINRATGRGGLGKLNKSAPILNAFFFSPRFLSSRLTLPMSLFSKSKEVRKIAARSIATFVGTGATILALVKLSGLADVEIDPRSTEFGKIKIGNTRLDFWGGFQPLVRYTAQFLTGQRKETTGKFTEIERGNVLGRFLESKLSPAAGLVNDLIEGRTFVGEELEMTPESFKQQIYNRLVPMFAQDMADAINDSGLVGGILGAFGAIGATVQTYDNSPAGQRGLNKLQGINFGGGSESESINPTIDALNKLRQ